MTLNDKVKTQGGKQGTIVNMEVGKIMTVKFPDDTVGVFHADLLTIVDASRGQHKMDPPKKTNGLKVMEDK